LYGGAEFSRDTDVVVLAEAENLDRLGQALNDLQATNIAVPPFDPDYLHRGHAVHFRCRHPEANGLRVDVMSVLRGVLPFPELWQRRTTIEVEPGLAIDLMALPDLVQAKKTQRDKDWHMIRRLVEAHYARRSESPNPEQVTFWLEEGRTASFLVEVGGRFPGALTACLGRRPLLALAAVPDLPELEAALELEEKQEREADRQYWLPLRKELEELRHQKRY
jgi:hypothetical protein